MRSWAALLGVLLSLLACSSASAVSSGNLWIDSDGGTCTRVATAGAYSNAAACPSLQAAFSASSGGDVVMIRSGSYSSGRFGMSTGGTRSPAVTAYVEPGGTATLAGGLGTYCNTNGLVLDGSQGVGGENGHQGIVGVGGLAFNGGGCSNRSLVVQNVTIRGYYSGSVSGNGGAVIYAENCQNVTLREVTINGDTGGDDGVMLNSTGGASGDCDNVTLDRVNLYNFSCSGTRGDHQDFLQHLGGNNLVVRNSRWIGLSCRTVSGAASGGQGYFLSCGFSPCANAVLENSVIGNVSNASDGAEISVYNASSLALRNNTVFDSASGAGATWKTETSPSPPSNVTFANNVTDATSCTGINILFGRRGTGAYGNNVLRVSCGHAGDLLAPSFTAMFVGPGSPSFDYHLAPGSFAIDKASASTSTATDLDGNARGLNPDAGAYEFSGTTPPPSDTTAPETTITASPPDGTAQAVSFSFKSNETGTFECRLDAGAYVACSSPKDYGGLAIGSHTFDVRATDAAGNTDPSPASANWTVTNSCADQLAQSQTDLVAMTASRDSERSRADAAEADLATVTSSRDTWKARTEAAEAKLSQIHDISAP